MTSLPLRFAFAALLCLTSGGVYAADAAAPGAPAAPAASAPAISLAQADTIIMQNGFTPVGQPKQKGNIIGSLARLGDKAFIVTVDAQTGQFLDAKPTTVALPVIAATPAATAAPAAKPAATTAAASTAAVSPVKRAADLARSKGFRVLSFRHRSDDTFLVAKRGNGLFSLKIDDGGHILAVVPLRGRADNDDD